MIGFYVGSWSGTVRLKDEQLFIVNVQQNDYINKRIMLIVAIVSLLCLLSHTQPPCYNSIWFIDACVNDCPTNYIYSAQNGYYQCKQCDITKGLIPNTQKYACVCAQQRYLQTYSGECIACHFTCFTCSGPNPSDCLTCDSSAPFSSRVMQNNICVCLPGFAENNYDSFKCQRCHRDCATCSGPNYYQCLTCSTNRTMDDFGNCICDNLMIPDSNGNCICPSPFIFDNYGKCIDPTTYCSLNEDLKPIRSGKSTKAPYNPRARSMGFVCECKTGYFRIKGLCQKCGQNQYYDELTGRCLCVPRANKTKTQNCVVCPANQYFNKKIQQCSCLKNQFKTETGQCIKCPARSIYKDGACRCVFNYYQNNKGSCTKCNFPSDHQSCQEVEIGFQKTRQLNYYQI